MTSRRKNFHTFNERQHYVFDCLYVGYFYFLSLNFWKRRCDKASTEQSDHSKNVEPYVTRGKILWQKHHVYSFILICRFKCFSLSTKCSYLSLSKPIIDSVDICNRMPRVVSPSSLLKQVFISFILENKCSTQAMPRGSINDNFNKRKKLEQKKKKL